MITLSQTLECFESGRNKKPINFLGSRYRKGNDYLLTASFQVPEHCCARMSVRGFVRLRATRSVLRHRLGHSETRQEEEVVGDPAAQRPRHRPRVPLSAGYLPHLEQLSRNNVARLKILNSKQSVREAQKLSTIAD